MQPKFAPWHFVGQGILMDEEEENECVLADLYDEPAAKLIEAAPDLYAALRDCATYIPMLAERAGEDMSATITRIAAALRKADGDAA